MQNERVELLAPAGNKEGFLGAIHAGADAVYLGGSRFGARAFAENFTTEELVGCIRYAHLWGRKVYLTLNTLVKESEFQDIYQYVLPYYKAGLDGVIVQDVGVLAYVKAHFPNMELHASTQMTLTGEYGAAMVKEMGVCRIVPARELSLQEISQIKKRTGLSIETFIHGAMCYCYSGQCLFSSILGGRSGNRGRCAQPCRLPYQVRGDKKETGECYPLSLKDMCTIEHIPQLIEAGIDSFKIEGRMKKPEYTAGVTAIYRKYIDKYYKNARKHAKNDRNSKKTTKFEVDFADLNDLSNLYIRSERQDGYYYKHNGRDMVTLNNPGYSGSDEDLLAKIRHDYLEYTPKKNIDIYADFVTGENASVTFLLGELSVSVKGEIVQAASRKPITEENIKKQLGKLGESVFSCATMVLTVSEDAFYPLGAINELRRKAVTALEDALIRDNGFWVCRKDALLPCDNLTSSNTLKITKGRTFVSVRRIEQLKGVWELISQQRIPLISRIYIDSDLLVHYRETILEICQKLSQTCEIAIELPYIIRERNYDFLRNILLPFASQYSDIFKGIMVRSLEGMGMLKSMEYQGDIYTDAGFYMWNRNTIWEWKETINAFCLPFELKAGEQSSLLKQGIPCEKIVYGRIPMMITANCVANSTSGCQKGTNAEILYLKDRYHKEFPVELNCISCMNIIYNSVPLSLHAEVSKWMEQSDIRLDFTIETKEETRQVLEYFCMLSKGAHSNRPPYKEYTTGHEKRGVE